MIGNSADWDATKAFTADLDEDVIKKLAKETGVSEDAIQPGSKVISYMDPNFPRDTWDDIFFYKRPEPVKKRDGGEDPLSIMGFGMVSGLALFGVSILRRR
ncbi:MAG: hypothetical protein ABL949_14405 [Fimbriimonadaceae bacterium]